MLNLISLLLAAIAILLAIPAAVLVVEVFASLRTIREAAASPSHPKRVAVVVPAHNEGSGVVPTIGDIRQQLGPLDRLIVVADNCTDDTASAASSAGAEVLLRQDATRIGKGYALAFAIEHLRHDAPDHVIFIDADCRVQNNTIDRLRSACELLDRPVQSGFLMKPADSSPFDQSFAQFAWIIKNWARPLGLRALGLPVQLMGTGMIFPWRTINAAPLASGNLVEDLKLGLDLAAAGQAPFFLPSAMVTSDFPVSATGTASQRQRWIKGHLSTIVANLPRLFGKALSRGDFDLLVLALDAAVPPLSLLGFAISTTFVVTAIAALSGMPTVALKIASLDIAMLAAALAIAWVKFGQEAFPPRAMLSTGRMLGDRLALYGRILTGKATGQWVRTDRSKADDNAPRD